jgi:outer membrane immunogenic protein
MKFKLLAPALGALALLLANGAQAHACSGGPFDGPYIGLNLGGGTNHARQSSPTEPFDLTASDSSVTVGGQLGYNLQCGTTIVGIETDFNYVNFETSTAWPDPVFLKNEVNWFGTVRGRLGMAIQPNAMLYVTGGLAYAGVTETLNSPFPSFHQSDDATKVGWTLGGGLELAHYGRWLIRTEALYVDLGSESRTYTTTGCGVVCTGHAKWDDSFWVARLGLSYKLGAREPVVPLK